MVRLMLIQLSVRVERVPAMYIAYFKTVESYLSRKFRVPDTSIRVRLSHSLGSISLDPIIGRDFGVFGSISICNYRRT